MMLSSTYQTSTCNVFEKCASSSALQLTNPDMPGPLSLTPAESLCCPAACTCSVHSSNFVMTAAAQNLLCLQLASGIGVVLDDPFKLWLVGGCVPAALGKKESDSSSTVKHCSLLQQCWLTESITRTSSFTVTQCRCCITPILTANCIGWATPTSTRGNSPTHWLFVDSPAGVVLTPCLLYWLWPPVVRNTPEGPATAAARLEEMGPLSTDETIMIGAVTLAVGLWVSCGPSGYTGEVVHMTLIGLQHVVECHVSCACQSASKLLTACW